MNKHLITVLALLLVACQAKQEDTTGQPDQNPVIQVASFTGQQVTGVTITSTERIFVNFPRWRENVRYAVVEIHEGNQNLPYPDTRWNSWEIGQPTIDSIFLAVQSVVAFEDQLYVLDTRNPLFQGVIDAPRIFVFDLNTNKLENIYILNNESYFTDSYINDLRVDKKNQKIYFTDSGHAGIVIVDMINGQSKRVLNNHKSTLAEQPYLTINHKKWENTVHSDGIAFDAKSERLYYHALTGYGLYSIDVQTLNSGTEEQISEAARFEGNTPAPDGMIFDTNGNLYLADLENHKILYRNPEGDIHSLVEGDEIKWADTFSIFGDELFFTNSRIHEASGDISQIVFTVNKVKLAK